MPTRSGIALLLIGLAFAVGLVAVLSPWWTVTFVSDGEDDGVRQVGPFDAGDGVIDTDSARLSGTIAVVGLVGLATSMALLGLDLGKNRETAVTNTPLVALAGGALLALALVFVIFAYPADFGTTSSFWGGDVATHGPTGFERAGAAYGWYLGGAAVLLAGAGAAVASRARTS